MDDLQNIDESTNDWGTKQEKHQQKSTQTTKQSQNHQQKLVGGFQTIQKTIVNLEIIGKFGNVSQGRGENIKSRSNPL